MLPAWLAWFIVVFSIICCLDMRGWTKDKRKTKDKNDSIQ
jgi:hypothetical protein